MCSGERIHRKEVEAYLRATKAVQRLTRTCRREVARERQADAYIALWKVVVDRLSGDDHETWCTLLRGPTSALDDALRRPLRLRFLDEIRATDGLRRKDLPENEHRAANEGVASSFYAAAADDTESVLEASADAARLRDAIGTLPAAERAAIEGVDLEEETFAAIARRMGVNESNVCFWRTAGLRRLQRLLPGALASNAAERTPRDTVET